jgi:hypothetical protein
MADRTIQVASRCKGCETDRLHARTNQGRGVRFSVFGLSKTSSGSSPIGPARTDSASARNSASSLTDWDCNDV